MMKRRVSLDILLLVVAAAFWSYLGGSRTPPLPPLAERPQHLYARGLQGFGVPSAGGIRVGMSRAEVERRLRDPSVRVKYRDDRVVAVRASTLDWGGHQLAAGASEEEVGSELGDPFWDSGVSYQDSVSDEGEVVGIELTGDRVAAFTISSGRSKSD